MNQAWEAKQKGKSHLVIIPLPPSPRDALCAAVLSTASSSHPPAQTPLGLPAASEGTLAIAVTPQPKPGAHRRAWAVPGLAAGSAHVHPGAAMPGMQAWPSPEATL